MDDKAIFELFRTELYTPVVGDILDSMGRVHQFLPQPIQPMRTAMKLIGRTHGSGWYVRNGDSFQMDRPRYDPAWLTGKE